MKIIKYIVFTIIVGWLLFLLGIMILGGYYVGDHGIGKIEEYFFKSSNIDLKNEIKRTSVKSKLIIKDSIITPWEGYNNILSTIKIKNKNTSETITYVIAYYGNFDESFYNTNKTDCGFFLIYINGKTNDDFGWFSWEKYKKVKLFEETIIEPLSDKYERIE